MIPAENKEAFMSFLANELGNKASLRFHVHQYNSDWSNVTHDNAKAKADYVSSLLGVSAKHDECSEAPIGFFDVISGDIRFSFTYVKETNKEVR
ncbi:MAG: hypothetical protein ACI35R_13240 [Bacillus sp. (in: firmicutes)]